MGKFLVSTLEAVNNAIIHGNKSDTCKFVEIEIFLKKIYFRLKLLMKEQDSDRKKYLILHFLKILKRLTEGVFF